MPLKLNFVTIDCRDPHALGAFWAEALEDYDVLEDPDDDPDDDEVVVLPQSRQGPRLLFIRVPDEKAGKNRLHFDLRPTEAESADEIARLEALGAKKVDIGQGDGVRWTVMADPEGNEFCVLWPFTDGEKAVYADWAW